MPKDKVYHFCAGLLIAIIGSIVFTPIEGIGLAIIAGILKECYDHYTYGKFDIYDMLVTWVGGCVGFTFLHLFGYWFS